MQVGDSSFYTAVAFSFSCRLSAELASFSSQATTFAFSRFHFDSVLLCNSSLITEFSICPEAQEKEGKVSPRPGPTSRATPAPSTVTADTSNFAAFY